MPKATIRPYYSDVRRYPWRDRDGSVVPGYGIFKGPSVCLHLTEKEAVDLANQLLTQIEEHRASE